jgi:glycosyltransferase involved in cell wall biosynthesis
MRIVFLAERSLIHTKRFTDYFTAQGHDAHLITFEEGFPINCPVHKLEKGPGPVLLSYLLRRHKVTELLGRLNPDLINAQHISSYGNLMATIPRHPWVATALGSDLLIMPDRDIFSRRRNIWALNRADLVTAMSDYMRDRIVSFGIPRQKIVVSCFGIDTAIFHSRGRHEHKAGEPWCIVCTRHLEPVYDHAALLEACHILARCGMDFKLILIGRGSLYETINRAIHAPDLRGRVELLGALSQPEVAEHLRRADLFVTASHSDGANISLLEAMACGTFPIASDIPANRQWGTDAVAMLRFPVGDANALAQQILRATQSPELVASARTLNYRTVEERGTIARNMGRLEQRFMQLADRFKVGRKN